MEGPGLVGTAGKSGGGRTLAAFGTGGLGHGLLVQDSSDNAPEAQCPAPGRSPVMHLWAGEAFGTQEPAGKAAYILFHLPGNVGGLCPQAPASSSSHEEEINWDRAQEEVALG